MTRRRGAPTWVALLFTFVTLSVAFPGWAHAYCTTGIGKWSSAGTKTMGVSTSFPAGMRAGLASALAQWNRSGSALVYSAPTYSSQFQIYSFKGSFFSFAGTSFPTNLPALASGSEASPHYGGTVAFNSLFTWINGSQNISARIADVQTIAVHEIGHFTGLAHPWFGACGDGTAYTAGEQASVMTTITTGTRRSLAQDDINAVTAFY